MYVSDYRHHCYEETTTTFFLNFFFFKFSFSLKLLYLSSCCAEALDCAKLSKSTGVVDVPYVTL